MPGDSPNPETSVSVTTSAPQPNQGVTPNKPTPPQSPQGVAPNKPTPTEDVAPLEEKEKEKEKDKKRDPILELMDELENFVKQTNKKLTDLIMKSEKSEKIEQVVGVLKPDGSIQPIEDFYKENPWVNPAYTPEQRDQLRADRWKQSSEMSPLSSTQPHMSIPPDTQPERIEQNEDLEQNEGYRHKF